MNSVYIIAIFNALFFSVLLIQKKSKTKIDFILINWLIYLAIFIGTYSVLDDTIFNFNNILPVAFLSLFIIQGIFLYIYVSILVSPVNFKKDLRLALMISAIILIVFFTIYLIYFIKNQRSLIEAKIFDESTYFLTFLILLLSTGPIFIFLSFRVLKRHRINIFNNFSNSENIKLSWLKNLLLVFCLVWFSLIIVTVLHHFLELFSNSFCTDGMFFSLSVFVVLIGYFGFRQKVIYDEFSVNKAIFLKDTNTKYKSSKLKDHEVEKLLSGIYDIMDSKKPFLNEKLTLSDLSDELKLSPHHLSQIINDKIGANFYDFINKYRIEEVKRKLNDNVYDGYTILGIAFDSGFNSKSAFNRIFKKNTGFTPSEYKDHLKKNQKEFKKM